MPCANSKRKRKLLRRAVELKKEVIKRRVIMVVLGIACAVAIIAYFIALFAGLIANNPFEQVICIVVAIIVGLFSVKATQSNRRYEDFLREYDLTKSEVNSFMRNES